MAATTLLVVLVTLLAVAVPVLLWRAIEAETDDAEVLDRESAERLARDESSENGRDPQNDEW